MSENEAVPSTPWNRLGAVYLMVQSLGATVWWLLLWLVPGARAYFRPAACPDVVLLAFFLPDALLFIGAALWAAHRLWKRPQQALLPLSLHVGAAVYAALFCLGQWILSGGALLAALFMAPCLCFGPLLLWKLEKSR